MSNKKGQYTPSVMLQNQGYIVPGKDINPIGFINKNRDDYNLIWTNYDFNQCCSRYIWKNLPNGLTSWNLERMLYFRGTLAGFKFAGRVYILPYVPSPSLNPYGFPSAIKPITYNGQAVSDKDEMFAKDFELPVNVYGDETNEYQAVLLYDALPYAPSGKAPSRFFLNQIIIKEMCEVFARININVVVSNKKIILQVKDKKQRDIVQAELNMAFGSDSPFAIISNELDVNNIQSSSDYNADDLFNTVKNYDAIRCFMSGISSKGFGAEKKERLVTGELTGAEEEKDLILDMGYDLRKMFADMCNKNFGTNIQVFKRSDFYNEENSTEINGQNQDAEQEITGGDFA